MNAFVPTIDEILMSTVFLPYHYFLFLHGCRAGVQCACGFEILQGSRYAVCVCVCACACVCICVSACVIVYRLMFALRNMTASVS